MKPHRKKKKFFSQHKLIIPFVFMLAVLWVWKANEANNLSRKLTELERTKKIYAEQNKLLQAELERYQSIAWIDRCVRQNYDMTYDVKKRIVLFDRPSEPPKTDQSLFASLADFIRRVFKSLINKK